MKRIQEIKEILEQKNDNFPFEYYSISFQKFSGQPYLGFKKHFKHIILDSTQINNEVAGQLNNTNNTAFGRGALLNNTTSGSNTAFGLNAYPLHQPLIVTLKLPPHLCLYGK